MWPAALALLLLSFPAAAAPPAPAVTGMTEADGNWQEQCIPGAFGNETWVVVAGLPGVEEVVQAQVRIRYVSAKKFEIRVQEPSCAGGNTGVRAAGQIPWMAWGVGTHHSDSGVQIIAGRVAISAVNGTVGWNTVTFPSAFPSDSVTVLCTVTTSNEDTWVSTALRNVNRQGFEVAMIEAALDDGNHALEIVSWLAVHQGSDHEQAVFYHAFTSTGLLDPWQAVSWPTMVNNRPMVFGALTSRSGEDTAALQARSIGSTGADVRVIEQKCPATVGVHQYGESYGLMVVDLEYAATLTCSPTAAPTQAPTAAPSRSPTADPYCPCCQMQSVSTEPVLTVTQGNTTVTPDASATADAPNKYSHGNTLFLQCTVIAFDLVFYFPAPLAICRVDILNWFYSDIEAEASYSTDNSTWVSMGTVQVLGLNEVKSFGLVSASPVAVKYHIRNLGWCYNTNGDWGLREVRFYAESPTASPSVGPSTAPSTSTPTRQPSTRPSVSPSATPTVGPSAPPTVSPLNPTVPPSVAPSTAPSRRPSSSPSRGPTRAPSATPSHTPSTAPTAAPSRAPSATPSAQPSRTPTATPSASPTRQPSLPPTTSAPTRAPSIPPTGHPSRNPSARPSVAPTRSPSRSPTVQPTVAPSRSPTVRPTAAPSVPPSSSPTGHPSPNPTASPSAAPSMQPSLPPSRSPTTHPTARPSVQPSLSPSASPTARPTRPPSAPPTLAPSRPPTLAPTASPSTAPSSAPSQQPSAAPTRSPSTSPSTSAPTSSPSTSSPTLQPTMTCACGHGVCVPGSCCPWRCRCDDDHQLGHWTGDSCDNCSAGWWGPNCKQQCPGGACRPCSAHGTCREGVGGDGRCECFDRWVGASCSECRAGWAGPSCSLQCGTCGGHGRCSTVDASCICDDGWDPSSGCGQRLPFCDGGCGGFGTCVSGTCVCDGRHWGSTCSAECRHCGAASQCDSAGACRCAAGFDASSNCSTCVFGLWGRHCTSQCPACNGHATQRSCDPATGACRCDPGWGGPGCAEECSAAARVCGGHGSCSTPATCICKGTCSCEKGWGGPACDKVCACGSHGVCAADGACECDPGWQREPASGAECSSCQPGLGGGDCLTQCVNGLTEGVHCKCNDGWSSPACDQPCPQVNGSRCGGHGVCLWGADRSVGVCRCESDWYGQVCTAHCSLAAGDCASLLHAACGPEGQCVCAADATSGYWSGSACDSCNPNFWGTHCTDPCDCGGHGTCSALDGRCLCFASTAQGWWGGEHCSECAGGYTGRDCAQREVPVTRLEVGAGASTASADPVFVVPGGGDAVVWVGVEGGTVREYGAENATAAWGPKLGGEVRLADADPVGAWATAGSVWTVANTPSGAQLWTMPRSPNSSHAVSFRTALAVSDAVAACGDPAWGGVVAAADGTLLFVDVSGVAGAAVPLGLPGGGGGGVAACGREHAVVCAGASCAVFHTGGTDAPRAITGTEQVLAAAVSEPTGLMVLAVQRGGALLLTATPLRGTGPAHETVVPESLGSRGRVVLVADPEEPFTYVFTSGGSLPRVWRTRVGGGVEGSKHLRPLETVTAAAASSAERVVYGATTENTQLVTVAMHWAEAAEPQLADQRGGTEVVVSGVGFGTAGVASCWFAETQTEIPAARLSAGAVVCTAPAVDSPKCTPNPVEVSPTGSRFARSIATLRFHGVPTVTSITRVGEGGAVSGPASTSALLRVAGRGLHSGARAMCVFHSAASTPRLFAGQSNCSVQTSECQRNAVVLRQCFADFSPGCAVLADGSTLSVHTPANISDGAAVCRQPRVAVPLGLRYLDVAVDGQIYTGSPLRYDVLHDPAALHVPAVHEVRPGLPEAALRAVVVDVFNRSVGRWDSVPNRTVLLHCCGGNLSDPMAGYTADGVAAFPALQEWPGIKERVEAVGAGGQLQLDFVEAGEGWFARSELRLLPGTAVDLLILQQPSRNITDAGLLSQQPVVAARDVWGTVCSSGVSSRLVVSVTVFRMEGGVAVKVAAGRQEMSADEGIVRFRDLVVAAEHSRDYFLRFSAAGLASVDSHFMQRMACHSGSYIRQQQCTPCPSEGAKCNGSDIVALPGYWLVPGGSDAVFRCTSPDACLGAAANDAQCAEGTAGALCEGCQSGYAKDRASQRPCAKCWAVWRGALVAVAMMACALIVITHCYMSCLQVQQQIYRFKAIGLRVCVLRGLIIFLQVLGKYGEFQGSPPEPLHSIVFFLSRLALFDFSLYQPFNCMIRTHWPLLQMYLMWPFVAALLAVALCPAFRLLGKVEACRRVKLFARLPGKAKRSAVIDVSMSTSFLLGFPTVLTHLLLFITCESYGTVSMSLVDSTTPCDDSTYRTQRTIASIAVLCYAAAPPVLFVTTFRLLRRRGWATYFLYGTHGFSPKRWYWLIVILVRELGVVLPAALLSTFPRRMEQIHVAMIVANMAMFAQLSMQPLNTAVLNRIELLSVTCTAVLLNLCPFFLFSGGWEVFAEVLSVVLTVGVVATVSVHVYYLLPTGVQEMLVARRAPKARSSPPTAAASAAGRSSVLEWNLVDEPGFAAERSWQCLLEDLGDTCRDQADSDPMMSPRMPSGDSILVICRPSSPGLGLRSHASLTPKSELEPVRQGSSRSFSASDLHRSLLPARSPLLARPARLVTSSHSVRPRVPPAWPRRHSPQSQRQLQV
eukprot:TRINITY_DN4368_c0_g1_i1.p1 TRINITY_DN4368_c0_g1~~TRINITY_DN4368_c0_g1_i1.p1  ORF type:complete len:2663 (+),score=688.74 TRINITY_DN4368_c0_g1_i1:103-8091(+)